MKLTLESINFINLFEKITRARVKDCIIEDKKLIFIVNDQDLSKAIGKDGLNVKKIKNLTKKDIQIIGFSEDIVKFVSNLIYPNKADEIKFDDKIVNILVKDNVIKGKIYGRDKSNLKRMNEITKRYFDVDNIKIS